jgi:hypothetical protein
VALGAELHRRLAGPIQAGRALSAERMALVTALADTILPRTDTPGAIEVGVPEFVDLLVAEWYPEDQKRDLLAGLDALDARARTELGKPFAELDPAGGGRAAIVGAVDGKDGPADSAEGAYKRLKEAIVFGYLTSKQIGPLINRTPIIPGRFDGCVPV